MPEQTQATISSDGFMSTGDVAAIDERSGMILLLRGLWSIV